MEGRLKSEWSINPVCPGASGIPRSKADIIGLAFRHNSRRTVWGWGGREEPPCTMTEKPQIPGVPLQQVTKRSANFWHGAEPRHSPEYILPNLRLRNQGEIENGDDDANEVDADYLYFDGNGGADWHCGVRPGRCSGRQATGQSRPCTGPSRDRLRKRMWG